MRLVGKGDKILNRLKELREKKGIGVPFSVIEQNLLSVIKGIDKMFNMRRKIECTD